MKIVLLMALGIWLAMAAALAFAYFLVLLRYIRGGGRFPKLERNDPVLRTMLFFPKIIKWYFIAGTGVAIFWTICIYGFR
jgi:hypothetical protein